MGSAAGWGYRTGTIPRAIPSAPLGRPWASVGTCSRPLGPCSPLAFASAWARASPRPAWSPCTAGRAPSPVGSIPPSRDAVDVDPRDARLAVVGVPAREEIVDPCYELLRQLMNIRMGTPYPVSSRRPSAMSYSKARNSKGESLPPLGREAAVRKPPDLSDDGDAPSMRPRSSSSFLSSSSASSASSSSKVYTSHLPLAHGTEDNKGVAILSALV